MPLIRFADPELFTHLEASLTEPYFATSWLITWLSHDIREYSTVPVPVSVLLFAVRGLAEVW